MDVVGLGTQMIDAAKGVIGAKWPEVKEYAEMEFKKIAENIVFIEAMKLQGKISEDQAKLHLELQKNASRTVLMTVEGLGLLMVEQALNAALKVVRDTVNTALGWALL